MPVSPEEKLYVKEEIEKISSKVKKTLGIFATILAIITGLGVYGLAAKYIDDSIKRGLEEKGTAALNARLLALVGEVENYKEQAQNSYGNIKNLEEGIESKKFISQMEKIQSKEIISHKGGLPLEGKFSSGGGVVVLLASGSGWSYNEEQIGMEVFVDNVSRGFAKSYTNEEKSHKSFVTNFIVIDTLPEGSHTVKLANWKETQTDLNDFFNVTILELPKF